MNTLTLFELSLLESINNFFMSFATYVTIEKIMIFFTNLGNLGVIWLIVGVILLIIKKTRPIGIAVLISLAIQFVVGEMIIKNLVQRMRPFTRMSFNIKIPKPTSYSFPSGHTMSSFAAATAIFIKNKKLGIPALTLATLIGFSRIFLMVHYPTDVLAGIILGIITGYIGNYLTKQLIESLPTGGQAFY